MTCTYERVHARFFESDKYSGATDMGMPNGYAIFVSLMYNNRIYVKSKILHSKDWKPMDSKD